MMSRMATAVATAVLLAAGVTHGSWVAVQIRGSAPVLPPIVTLRRTGAMPRPALRGPRHLVPIAQLQEDIMDRERSFGPRRLLGYLWPESGAVVAKLRVLGALGLLLAAKLLVVRVPLIFKRCIDSLSTGSVLGPAGWMVAYGFARAAYTLLQEGRYLLFTPVGQNALRRFMRDAFEHVQSLDAGWLGSQSTGELSRVFSRGMRGLNSLLRLVVFNVVPTALEAALVLQLLGRRYGTAFLAAAGLCVVSFVTWSLWVVENRVKMLQELNDNDNAIFTRFFNSLLNNEAVRLFTNEKLEVSQYDQLLSKLEVLSVRDVQLVSVLNAGQALIFSAGLGSIMALCASRVASGALTIGDVVAIHGMLLQLQAPLTALGFTYQDIRQSLTDMRQLLLLLRRTPKVSSRPSAPPLVVSEGVLRFEGVSFGYSGNMSLRNVTFEVPANKKTAIVGASGSGKSTVLKLISRTYDPDSGRVTIDGQDLRHVCLRSLRQQLGYVPQDTILFDDTMLYNLKYGDVEATDAAALAVAARVGLDATASKLAQGYRTRVGERGLTLSGGERQRVAIARALLKDPPLMLYDEPTSALDSLTEQSITQQLALSAANRTSVVVAHKLRSIEDADLIIVMANGTVAEQGTHAALLCKPNSTYSRMWAQQQYGDEWHFQRDGGGPPDYCDYVAPDFSRERVQEVEEALALVTRDGNGGWLW